GPLTESLYKVIADFKQQYENNFRTHKLVKNVGLGPALNTGLKICKNELIARMDTDDISLPNRCELQLKEFEIDPNLTILGTNVDEFYDDPENIISSRVVPANHQDILQF